MKKLLDNIGTFLIGVYIIVPCFVSLNLIVLKALSSNFLDLIKKILGYLGWNATPMLSLLGIGVICLVVSSFLKESPIKKVEERNRNIAKEEDVLEMTVKEARRLGVNFWEFPSFFIFVSAPFSLFLVFVLPAIVHLVDLYREIPLSEEVFNKQEQQAIMFSGLIYAFLFLHGLTVGLRIQNEENEKSKE